MRFRIPVVLALSAFAVGCLDKAEVDEDETVGNLVTTPQQQDFNPSRSVIPFPNILLLSPTTGLNTLPATCGESAGAATLRQGVLNTLDGVGTWLPAIYTTFTAEVDLTVAAEHVYLIKQVADPADAETVPVQLSRFQQVRYSAALPTCGEQSVVEGIAITPLLPLDDDSVYTVAVTQGVTSRDGEEFQPSSAWFFSRQSSSPVGIYDRDGDGVLTVADVEYNNTPIDQFDPRDLNGNGVADTIETLAGIQQLSGLNQRFLPFVDAALDTVIGENVGREDILIAWAFKTQTEEAPLDMGAAAGPASEIDPAVSTATLGAVPAPPSVVIETALGAGACTQLPCTAVGTFFQGAFGSKNYQTAVQVTSPVAADIPSNWDNPLTPRVQDTAALDVVAAVPASAAPAAGYPVVIFGHGLTRSRQDLYAIAAQLAQAGIASISTDWPLHGNRAVQIYPTGSACQTPADTGEPDPTQSAACFSPILTANLPATRDNFRQGTIDVLGLIEAVKQCDAADPAAGCGDFLIDPTRIGYMGQSLGSLIGTLPVAMSTDIKAAVMNVPSVSLTTILENTDTATIKCPLIDALINNGTIQGNVWQLPAGGFNTTDATCLANATANDPIPVAATAAYRSFAAAARWILDPADGVNFLDVLGAKVAAGDTAVLIQQVQGDTVIPNEATALMARLLGFTSATTAATPASQTPPPSEGIASEAPALYLNYVTTGGAVYAHGSLLSPPAGSGTPGALGTIQMQTDAITFLATRLAPAAE